MRISRRTALGLLVLVLLANVGAALLPFRLDPPRRLANEVVRLPDGSVAFGAHNALRSANAPEWLAEVLEGATLTVEMRARPEAPQKVGHARLFALSHSPYRANLVIAQRGDDLVVRVRRPGSEPWGSPDFVVAGALPEGRATPLAVVLGQTELFVDVDGRRRVEADLAREYTRHWSATSRVALGDEPAGGRAWRGVLGRAVVTVRGRRHDLLAPGALEAPAATWVFPERVRRPVRFGAHERSAALIHLLAFFPLGYLLAALGRGRHPRLRAVAIAGALAGVLFAARGVIAERHPNLVDVATQLAGAAIGARVSRPSRNEDAPPRRRE